MADWESIRGPLNDLCGAVCHMSSMGEAFRACSEFSLSGLPGAPSWVHLWEAEAEAIQAQVDRLQNVLYAGRGVGL